MSDEPRHVDQAAEEVANVAFLPGIQRASLAMRDIHWGCGFCIGGVCATDPDAPGIGGVISPGGLGYDINCGVRLSQRRTVPSHPADAIVLRFGLTATPPMVPR